MEVFETHHRWARPLALLVALLVIAWTLRAQPQPATIAPPHALDVPPALQGELDVQIAPTAGVAPAPLADHTPVIATARLALYTSNGSYSTDQVRALAQPLADALSYVSQRTAMQPNAPITVVFDRRDGCGFDGAAYTERRTIMVYACPDVPQQRAVNIVAHEFVHQLAHDHYGEAHLQADLILSEGLATWGAGKYWLGNEADFRSFVQRHYMIGLLPLGSHYRDYGTVDAMNRLYYEWAALVDFLISTHGRDAFDQLYTSGHGMEPNTADYTGVVGSDLNSLEQQWKDWLAP